MSNLKVISYSELKPGQKHAAFISEWGARTALAVSAKDPWWWIWQTDRDPNARWAVVEDET